jgi:aryl-alcohol dehydrogenase-like predicted oxidoreductase
MRRISEVALGANGPLVGAQGLGCMGMSEFYGARDDEQSLATLHHAVDRGVTLIDTADMYGQGHNETLIARLLQDRRGEVVIATKFGFVRKTDDPGYFGLSNAPDHIRQSVDASLRRLGTAVIDLYYMHRRDPAVPIAESVGVMAELVAAGKVRHLGLSEVGAAELREAHAIHPIAAVQSEWSLFSRDVEADVVPACAELGVGFVAYSPLGRGQLTGAAAQRASDDPADIRNYLPRFVGEEGEANGRLVRALAKIAEARGVTAAQVALAWLHGQSGRHGLTVVPIPGTRSAARLDENLAALDLALEADEQAALDSLAEAVVGIRPV